MSFEYKKTEGQFLVSWSQTNDVSSLPGYGFSYASKEVKFLIQKKWKTRWSLSDIAYVTWQNRNTFMQSLQIISQPDTMVHAASQIYFKSQVFPSHYHWKQLRMLKYLCWLYTHLICRNSNVPLIVFYCIC